MSMHTGFTDRVRKILESAPGELHSVAAIEAALGEHAPPKPQPIYNALHELVKTGEIRRIKKSVGNGSNYYWPNHPDEYDCPPALTQAVNAMRTQKPVSHLVKTVLDYDPGTRSASFTRGAPSPPAVDNYKGLVVEPLLGFITRWQQRDDTEDLRKARHFLDLLIEHLEKRSTTGGDDRRAPQ